MAPNPHVNEPLPPTMLRPRPDAPPAIVCSSCGTLIAPTAPGGAVRFGTCRRCSAVEAPELATVHVRVPLALVDQVSRLAVRFGLDDSETFELLLAHGLDAVEAIVDAAAELVGEGVAP